MAILSKTGGKGTFVACALIPESGHSRQDQVLRSHLTTETGVEVHSVDIRSVRPQLPNLVIRVASELTIQRFKPGFRF